MNTNRGNINHHYQAIRVSNGHDADRYLSSRFIPAILDIETGNPPSNSSLGLLLRFGLRFFFIQQDHIASVHRQSCCCLIRTISGKEFKVDIEWDRLKWRLLDKGLNEVLSRSSAIQEKRSQIQ